MASEFKDHFSKKSVQYSARRPTYPVALAEYLSSLTPARDLVLDCGCGTGQLSILLSRYFKNVVATDASEAQIKAATPTPNIIYKTALAEESGLENHSVDLITVAQAAHWFNLAPFYEEVRRVAKKKAVIALITYGMGDVAEAEINQVVHDFYLNTIGPYWPPERKSVEAGYQDLPFPFDEFESKKFAIETDWNLDDLVGYLDTWSAVRGAEKALGHSPIPDLKLKLAQVWGAPETKRKVTWPLSIRIGFVS